MNGALFVPGAVMVAGPIYMLWDYHRDPLNEARWRGLRDMSDALSAVGVSRRFVTRGYLVNTANLMAMGLMIGLVELIELGWVPEVVGVVGGIALLAVIVGAIVLAAVVARTGKPARFIPQPFR